MVPYRCRINQTVYSEKDGYLWTPTQGESMGKGTSWGRDELPTEADVKNRDPEAFVIKDPLMGLLAPRAKVQILLALIHLSGEKVNPAAICERATISKDTWYEHREDLIDTYGVVEIAGHAGNSPLYRVDMDDPIIKRLTEILDIAADRRNRLILADEE